MKNKNNSKPYESEMTYSQANALNNTYKDNAAFMAQIGTEENPEFIYPEELQAASIIADKDNKKIAENKLDKYKSNNNPWSHYLFNDPNPGDAGPLGDIAAISIGVPLSLTSPVTVALMEPAHHAAKVMMNPLAAETAVGGAAAATADVYFAYKGLEHAANIIDKWRNGNFDWEDIPNFGLGVMGTIPGISHGMNAYRNATNMFNAANQINKAKKNCLQILWSCLC